MNELNIECIAMVAHEANRAWCAANGDTSQKCWHDAPDWQKDSAKNGVEFHLSNPYAGDSASHDNWVKEKVACGWVYGEVKDEHASPPTHHCLVPFGDLPNDQQAKDAIFRSIVHAISGAYK